MGALRDKHYHGIPDNFDDDVKPKLVKKLNGVRIARARASHTRTHAHSLTHSHR